MKRLAGIAAVLGLVMVLAYGLYDPMPESQALFREGAPTEEVLAAEEREEIKSLPTWVLITGIVLLIPYGILKIRK